MTLSSSASPAAQRGRTLIGIAVLGASMAWLVSRVVIGLDFTDEMQHYVEIAALTRTGRFFEVDFFIQQLGYVLLLPLFKVHAALFPDQSYLVAFGRVVLLAGYAAVALAFWRSSGRRAAFPVHVRLGATALFAAWIPFQLFSPNYNTLAYLLLVAALAYWQGRDRARSWSGATVTGALLAGLTATYPPAGLILAALLALDAARRDRRSALRLAGLTLGCGLLLGGVMFALHGAGFLADLATAVHFSNSFALHVILEPDQLASLGVLVFTGWLFVRRVTRRVAFRTPFSPERPRLSAFALAGFVPILGALLWMADRWLPGLRFFPAAVSALLIMLLAGSIAPCGTVAGETWTAAIPRWVLVMGCAALLLVTLRWSSGYFATAVWISLLCAVTRGIKPGDERSAADIVVLGTLLGATFAITSGNGLHNFGVGAMVAVPFLALYARDPLASASGTRAASAAALAVSALVVLQLAAGARHPYREERAWWTFRPVVGVPAFKGIRTSSTKLEALQTFEQLVPRGRLAGQRLLIAGPQPWFYFVTSARPATPMAYMHFSGGLAVDQFLAAEFFRHGEPDAILVPNALPLPLHGPLAQWMAKGFSVTKVTLPEGLIPRFRKLTRYEIANEIMLLRRTPPR